MAKPNVTWLWNNTVNDGANSGNASGGAGASSSNWVVVDLVNDVLCFFDSQQSDGDSNGGAKYPVIIPASGSTEAPKTFVNDNSESVFDQVPLAGTSDGGQSGGNTQYVFAIYFDGATAGIPYLEAWDDTGHDATDSDYLGAGTPADSTLHGITTTNGAPGGATWAGTPLAGESSRLSLDTAALGGAQNLYFNLHMDIPSTFTAQTDSSAVLALRYLYS